MGYATIEFSDAVALQPSASSWSYTMPSGIEAGDILLAMHTSSWIRPIDENADDSATSTTWTKQADSFDYGNTGTPPRTGPAVWAKVALGDEDGKIYSWTTNFYNLATAAIDTQGLAFYVIRGAPNGLSSIAVSSVLQPTTTQTTVTMPTLSTHSWGASAPTTVIPFIAMGDFNNRGVYPSTYPYAANNVEETYDTISGNNFSAAACSGEVTSASIAPGDYVGFDNRLPVTGNAVDIAAYTIGIEGEPDSPVFESISEDLATPFSVSHTLSSSANRIVLMFVSDDGAANTDANANPVYGGIAGTRLGVAAEGATEMGVWYVPESALSGLTPGAQTATCSGLDGNASVVFHVVEYSNVDKQTIPTAVGDNEEGTTALVSTAINTIVDNAMLVSGSITSNGPQTWAAQSGQVFRAEAGTTGYDVLITEKLFATASASATQTFDPNDSNTRRRVAYTVLLTPPQPQLFGGALDGYRRRRRDPRIKM